MIHIWCRDGRGRAPLCVFWDPAFLAVQAGISRQEETCLGLRWLSAPSCLGCDGAAFDATARLLPCGLSVLDGAASYAALPHSESWLLKCTVQLSALVCLWMCASFMLSLAEFWDINNCITTVSWTTISSSCNSLQRLKLFPPSL